MMTVSSCEARWFLKVTFQDNFKVTEKISLTRLHQEVINLNNISENDSKLSLLDVESSFSIKYDTSSNKLLDVQLEAI